MERKSNPVLKLKALCWSPHSQTKFVLGETCSYIKQCDVSLNEIASLRYENLAGGEASELFGMLV